jgi:hypothetical protein
MATTKKTVSMWMGKSLDDMTKAELKQALIDLGQMYDKHLKQSIETLGTISSWEKPKWWKGRNK